MEPELNPIVGFSSLKYSVQESEGKINLVVMKKNIKENLKVGVRTKSGTANENFDYKRLDRIINIKEGELEQEVSIEIMDDDEVEDDEDFYVELYDIHTNEVLSGKDTICTVTIIDNDGSGTFQFENSRMTVSENE